MQAEPLAQPLLPRISMRWYFVAVLVVGALITWAARSAYQQNLLVLLLLCGLAGLVFLVLSAACFAVAYLVGAVERVFFDPEDQPRSPFARDSLPPQIIPPYSNE